ncbi:alpha-hydroxy acid oxidase [Nocardioides sp. T2.26MG-1]|uniref:alpha-hydroxy acid oxidase n=1 Tax=Nocardioides sp. T2.26MG-1 TaxID=3041166 RepID=UPI0024777C86|nr:alpha-hydroxy acid oxidase [Nocardioides sp. T2.26MG-1]CAI9406897.1 4-hydroxymandelate oxidase [Nocardioides sp. T2.26MG-1]
MDTDARWLDELEQRAREVLPASVLEYVLQGARESVTAGEATAGWRAVRFRPRVLHDVTHVETGVSLLGQPVAVPWGVAPSTLQRAVHPEGELAMARACAEAGSLMVVSSNAGTPFAEIGATGVDWWVQAYLPADRTLAEPMLERAVAAGARAVVLTVDTPVVATKYASPGIPAVWDTVDPAMLRVNFDAGYDEQPGAEKALDLGPHDIGWVAARTGLPVVVKGVLRAEDAVRCVQAGAGAVWVSNHGGRQLDRTAATSSCLPEVVGAVGERAEVYVDGGLRHGLDVLAALALGARAVFLGRSPLLALLDGADGVARLHRELRVQTVEALRLAGCRTASEAPGLAAAPRPTPL